MAHETAPGPDQPATSRWQARPRSAGALRTAVFAGPVVASAAAGWALSQALPPSQDLAGTALVWVATVTVSVVALVVTDRLLRRLLPVAVLLRLALVFPEQAPSRLRMAREVVRRRSTEEHLARLARAAEDPSLAAEVILGLVAAMDDHDRPTRGHAERVRLYTDLIAGEMGLPPKDRDRLRWASLLHDIGKLAVPAAILNKPGKPDDAEWEMLHRHPDIGAELARPLLPWLGEWGDLIAQHHERYDGTGYPRGLAGAQICRGGRIVAVADAFDVMTAARAYRRPVARPAAYRELLRCSGTQFDPEVVRAMLAVSVPRIRRVQGALAVLSDVPLLAARTVPAATLAQAVGAGVLVVGGAQLGPPSVVPTLPATVTAPGPQAPDQAPDADVAQPAQPQPDAPPDAEPMGGPDAAPAAPAAATGTPQPVPVATGPDATSDAPSAPPPSPPPDDTAPLPAPSSPVPPVTDTVENVVDDTVGTVRDVVEDPVGSVDDAVDTTTSTVEDTVDDVLGLLGP